MLRKVRFDLFRYDRNSIEKVFSVYEFANNLQWFSAMLTLIRLFLTETL